MHQIYSPTYGQEVDSCKTWKIISQQEKECMIEAGSFRKHAKCEMHSQWYLMAQLPVNVRTFQKYSVQQEARFIVMYVLLAGLVK